MESTETQAKLELNTKGFCFLCLREQNDPLQDIKMEPDSSSPLMLFSYQSLLQFLNMDKKKILDNLCAPVESLKALEKAELMVQLCSKCNSTTQQFLVLYKKLEIIQKGLNAVIHKIHDVMANAEEDHVLGYFNAKMTCGNEGMVNSKIIHNLRRDTMEKCLNKISSSTNAEPQVSLLQVSELDPSTSSSSVRKKTLSECSPSPSADTKCSYCPASFTCPDKSTEHWRLQVHLYVHHCEQLFKEYRNPTITPYHFKVCCALVFQNFSESEKGFHCPYCPYIYQRKPSGSVKSFVFPHMMDTHKDELILRLQDLQRKDQDELLQTHRDLGGKSCEECGDLLYSAYVLNSHVKNYCLKVKNRKSPGNPNASLQNTMNFKKYPRGNMLRKISNKYKTFRPESKFISEGMETEEANNSQQGYRQCPHCPAKVKGQFQFRSHLFTFHLDKHMAGYRLPSVSTQHFKVCTALVRNNISRTKTHFVCPYCPYSRPRTRAAAKGLISVHMVDTHAERVIQRLHVLQKLDMNRLLNSQEGKKGRTCEGCGDFFPSHITYGYHAKLYCPSNKRKRTGTEEEGGDNKKMKLNEYFNSDSEDVVQKFPEPVRKTTAPSRKKVICSICGEEYSDSASLQKHKSTHTPDSVKNLSFPCPHCPQVLDFYLTLRAHLMKFHPVIMFRTHLPLETSSEEIENALNSLIPSLSKTIQGERESEFETKVKHSCTLCLKEYVDFEELESHILVTHFNKVKLRLRELIMKKNNGSEGNIGVVKVEN